MPLYERTDAANVWEPHMHICLHHAYASSTKPRGAAAYYFANSVYLSKAASVWPATSWTLSAVSWAVPIFANTAAITRACGRSSRSRSWWSPVSSATPKRRATSATPSHRARSEGHPARHRGVSSPSLGARLLLRAGIGTASRTVRVAVSREENGIVARTLRGAVSSTALSGKTVEEASTLPAKRAASGVM